MTRPRKAPGQERILIVEVNWLGDILFSTPAIRALHRVHPGAYIAALVVPRGKAVLMSNPYLDELIVWDETGRHRGWTGMARLARDLRARRFTTAYLLKPSFTRTFLLWLAGIRRRVGMDGRGRLLLTETVTPAHDPHEHRADRYYRVVMRRPVPSEERYCDFVLSPADRKFVEAFLKFNQLGNGRDIVTLHVGGNWDKKRWPRENFARLIDALKERYDADVVISGSVDDDLLAQEIAALAARKPFVSCGQTTLKQLGALFEKSALVISGDFGPTSPGITGPLGTGGLSILQGKDASCVIPCYRQDCSDNACMKAITVEQVLQEIERAGWLKRPM
jgi:heptosyltransferase-2